MSELTGPIVRKDDAKRIAYAAVLVPGEPDTDYPAGEKILTADEIERVAHEWLESYRNVDIQHTLNNVATPVESYILPMEMTVTSYSKTLTLPAGTWILATKVHNDEVWAGIQSGHLTGYSIMGIRRDDLNKSEGVPKSASMKRLLIKDLGADWITAFVSIVDEPAVPKAKFFALKAKAATSENENDGENLTDTTGKSGRKFSKATMVTLTSISKALSDLISNGTILEEDAEKEKPADKSTEAPTMTKEEISQAIKEALAAELPALVEKAAQEATAKMSAEVTPLKESIAALETTQKEKTAALEGAVEAMKSDVSAFKEEVVTRVTKSIENFTGKKAAPKALPGQDGTADKSKAPEPSGRDSYGRARRSI